MKGKKEITLWADDDWESITLKELKSMLVEGSPIDKPCFGIFHYRKNGCYEGKPRRVQVIIKEIV